MHNRQSGAAHVPIMFFLLLLILFLAAVTFAWMNQTKNNELVQQRQEALQELKLLKNKALLIEHYLVDTGNVIGKPGKYLGRKVSEGAYDGASLEGMVGVMNPEEIGAVMDKALADAGLGSAKGLENVLGVLVTNISQLKDRIKSIEAKRDEALAAQAKTESALQAKTKDVTDKATWYQGEISRVEAQYTTNVSATKVALEAAQREVGNLAKEKLDAEAAATERENDLKRQIAERDHRLYGLARRETLRNAPTESDGTIIAAKKGLATAFINLGRKDLLQAGTIFRVRAPNSGTVKCKATVIAVGEDRSEVQLSEFADEVADYARDGDQLYNELFSPRMVRTIYLMGRFQAPYHKDQLSALLRRLGNKVVDKMGPGVDTVILGNDPLNNEGDGFARVQDSAEYKQAVELKAEFANLSTIRDLIKL